ncbi:MAG TPA: hypothetical protein VLH85_02360 [Levilinea sp.]|nr:hypothetical protein [Levilinea sp.]
MTKASGNVTLILGFVNHPSGGYRRSSETCPSQNPTRCRQIGLASGRSGKGSRR